MKDSRRVLAHSDSGFRREEKDNVPVGRATRGANYIRVGTCATTGKPVHHLLEWVSSQLKQVTRSTFTSEAGALLLATDSLIVVVFTLHEITTGPASPDAARRLMDEGGMSHEAIGHGRVQPSPDLG